MEDHHSDPDIIAGWSANKTPEFVATLIEHPDIFVMVAERAESIAGVGAGNRAGEITLNYVAPEARFTGVSSGLLKSLEAAIIEAGHGSAKLTSTKTARAFYRARGYVDDGEPIEWRGALGFPMRKLLVGR
ncbi:GNAT family N-acetyltransferase [Pelagibacterium limicola]|uniref:GNAT family N-acetyltransferase n=1 Tax=Pelagibacterium limicola TaxID=2791022 RepID=UPI001FE5DDDA|nr:GNAT family N-acetyltransferase [Pelagibacterium limicola]